MKITGSRQIVIDSDPTDLWWMVADIENMGRWSPITTVARWVAPDDSPRPGARFQGTNAMPIVRRWTSPATVIRAVEGVIFEFAVGKNPADPNTIWTYEFTPHRDGSTQVTERWDMRREPWIVLAYYRLVGQRRRVESGVEATLRALKEAAETS